MSYILEALKKAEERRKQEAHSSVLHQSPPRPPSYHQQPPQIRITYVLLFAATIIFLAGGSWYYFRTDTEIVHPVGQETVVAQPDIAATETPPAILPALPPATSPEEQIPELLPGKNKIAIQTALASEKTTIIEPKPIGAEEEIITEQREQPQENVLDWDDLPAVLKESLPTFKLAGHVYSPDPDSRLIIINNAIVREGDIVEKDFILDEITMNGVILKYRDIRFQLHARQ